MNENILNKKIKQHDKIMNEIKNKKDDVDFIKLTSYLIRLRKMTKEICLVLSGFKCERCGINKNLQYHHKYQRSTKNELGIINYIIKRHNFRNIVILCFDCHNKEHKVEKYIYEKTVLNKKYINTIKKKYYCKDYNKEYSKAFDKKL